MSFERTELLLGREGVEKLARSHVTVCGLGGVGAYAVEALARANIGRLTLVDCDVISPSNINRQLLALESTKGMEKTEVARARVKDIHPGCDLTVMHTLIDEKSDPQILAQNPDVIIDAIDSLSAKVHLIANAFHMGIHVVSSMGAAGRLDANAVTTGDLSETHTCPLARFVRSRLHRREIYTGIRCVFSTEKPVMKKVTIDTSTDVSGKSVRSPVIGSISYLPSIFGLKAAYEAITYLLHHKS